MIKPLRFCAAFWVTLSFAAMTGCATAPATRTAANGIGVVIMHGKGGSPSMHVSGLASSLQAKGYAVANIEMPWSGRRSYDVDVGAAEKEVDAALTGLRENGAKRLFVAGHSQGALFALYYGNQHNVDGIIAIAPGGDVGSEFFRSKLGPSVQSAKQLVAAGKASQIERFHDYEGSTGLQPVNTTASNYLSWFEPDGAMNESKAIRNMNPATPVLFIGPTGDYTGLLKVKQAMFGSLPRNPQTKLYEPNASHLGAPIASAGEIMEWTTAIAAQ